MMRRELVSQNQDQTKGKVKSVWRSRLLLLARLGVAIGLVIVILNVIDFNSVEKTLAGTDVRWIIVIMPIALFDRYLMAYKWAMLLRAQDIPFSVWEAFRAYMSS